MAEPPKGKLAVILHADVVGSTSLVQRDERIAHNRIQDAFRRFAKTIETYSGTADKVRGDALLAEHNRASDAVAAALAFQAANNDHNNILHGEIRPKVRIEISLGEVVIADGHCHCDALQRICSQLLSPSTTNIATYIPTWLHAI